MLFCGVRESTKSPLTGSFVTVVPAAIITLSGIFMGATSCVSLPTNTFLLMMVWYFALLWSMHLKKYKSYPSTYNAEHCS